MGFWKNLVESYDDNADALKSSYPLSTTSISNNTDIIAVIVIDGDGNFIKAEKIEKAKIDKKTGAVKHPLVNVTIPVTEDSLGRSSGISPHPVFDQYEYLKGDGKKYDAYIERLKKFAESTFSTKQVKAISKYAEKCTVASDLLEMGLKDKTNIVFKVEIPENPRTAVWEDETFFNAWHQYYLALKKKRAEEKRLAECGLEDTKKLTSDEKKRLKKLAKIEDAVSLDYITGAEQISAVSHPKKISNASANSKLVSDNDKTNYTFRGKFTEPMEALSIGYEASQKAHQFLRYLINDRGYYCGEQVIITFTIGSAEDSLPPPIEDDSIANLLRESQTKTERDAQIALRAETGIDYAEALRKSLLGTKYGKALTQHARTAVIALDAATTGRLSITFYRELDQTEYLEKIADWHSSCQWRQQFWDNVNEIYVSYTGSPSVDKIIEAVYGKPRGVKDESYTKIKKVGRERLLRCIFDGAFLPKDYVVEAVRRASNPLSITKNGKFDRNTFGRIVSTTCALVRKEHQQLRKEDYKLSIEHDRRDRNYLYGRLLGAADKLEEYALYRKGNERIVTAAIRYMQAFSQHPFRTWKTIHDCLNPCIQKVKGSFAFQEIEAIKELFATEDYEDDAPLNGLYLIGYYHERAYIDNLVKDASSKKESTSSNKEESSHVGQ
jgi:CRISPR-associated protein Csd1